MIVKLQLSIPKRDRVLVYNKRKDIYFEQTLSKKQLSNLESHDPDPVTAGMQPTGSNGKIFKWFWYAEIKAKGKTLDKRGAGLIQDYHMDLIKPALWRDW